MARRCLKCGTDQHAGPEEEMAFRLGEVFGIRESVFTPIEDILRRISGLTGDALRRSRSSFHSLRSRRSATHKRRPCILMDQILLERDKGRVLPHVCLMCTFEKRPIDDLPQIFRHFCLQVITEDAKVVEDAHLHSIPVWPLRGEMQWIIMWKFQTTRELLGRWPQAGCGERTGMAFGKKAISKLDALCAKKQLEWKAFCDSQPGFAEEQERQINDHKKTWTPSTAGSQTTSQGSQESTVASRRPGFDVRSIISETIFEDQVSIFNEKVQYATYQSGVRGPESVRPKRNRRRSRGSGGKSNTCSLASVTDGASVCGMGLKQRSPTREAFNNLAKRLAVVAPWGTA